MTTGMRHIALARQPILDRHGALVAYELLFRYAANDTEAHLERGAAGIATASVIQTAFADMGMAQVLGRFLGYINVDTSFLLSGYVSLLPAEKVVLELLEDIDSGADVVARCEALKKQGYRIALDDYDGRRADLKPLLALADVVKVDLTLVQDGGRQFMLDVPQGPSWFELSVSRKPYDGDGSRRFIVVSRDITSRKRVERRCVPRKRRSSASWHRRLTAFSRSICGGG